MRAASLMFVGLMLAGCDRYQGTPSDVFSHYGDRLKAQAHGLFGVPCRSRNGTKFLPSQCYRFGPRKSWSGILIVRSRYHTDFVDQADLPPNDIHYWKVLSDDASLLPKPVTMKPTDKDVISVLPRAYRIRFAGRATRPFNGGLYDYLQGIYLVERIDEIKRVPFSADEDVHTEQIADR